MVAWHAPMLHTVACAAFDPQQLVLGCTLHSPMQLLLPLGETVRVS